MELDTQLIGFHFRYDPPEGYVATSHIVKKKPTVRMVSCWAPLRESFESIVEEDQYPGEESPSQDSGVHGRSTE